MGVGANLRILQRRDARSDVVLPPQPVRSHPEPVLEGHGPGRHAAARRTRRLPRGESRARTIVKYHTQRS